MKSLRTNIETTFAAAAFAERNLNQETREVMGEISRAQAPAAAARSDAKAKRPRPSLKA